MLGHAYTARLLGVSRIVEMSGRRNPFVSVQLVPLEAPVGGERTKVDIMRKPHLVHEFYNRTANTVMQLQRLERAHLTDDSCCFANLIAVKSASIYVNDDMTSGLYIVW